MENKLNTKLTLRDLGIAVAGAVIGSVITANVVVNSIDEKINQIQSDNWLTETKIESIYHELNEMEERDVLHEQQIEDLKNISEHFGGEIVELNDNLETLIPNNPSYRITPRDIAGSIDGNLFDMAFYGPGNNSIMAKKILNALGCRNIPEIDRYVIINSNPGIKQCKYFTKGDMMTGFMQVFVPDKFVEDYLEENKMSAGTAIFGSDKEEQKELKKLLKRVGCKNLLGSNRFNSAIEYVTTTVYGEPVKNCSFNELKLNPGDKSTALIEISVPNKRMDAYFRANRRM